MSEVIIAHYLNVDGMTRQQAQHVLAEYHSCLPKTKTDIHNIILPVANQPTKIEVVFDGREIKKESDKSFWNFVNQVEDLITLNPENFFATEMRRMIRNMKIKKLSL